MDVNHCTVLSAGYIKFIEDMEIHLQIFIIIDCENSFLGKCCFK